jgi:hypothetical protein
VLLVDGSHLAALLLRELGSDAVDPRQVLMSCRDGSECPLHIGHVWLEGRWWFPPCRLLPLQLQLGRPQRSIVRIFFRRLILPPLLFLILLIVVILGEVDLLLDAGGEAVTLDGLRGEVACELEEGYLINGGFGEGVLEAIVEIAHIVQVPLREVALSCQTLHLQFASLKAVHMGRIQSLHHQSLHSLQFRSPRHRTFGELSAESRACLSWLQLGRYFCEDEDHNGVQETVAVHHIFKFRILIFDEEKQYPKDCHKVEARLIIEEGVGGTELIEDGSIFFIDAVAELDPVGLGLEPERGFPPLCHLPSYDLQQLFLGEATGVTHDVFDGDA